MPAKAKAQSTAQIHAVLGSDESEIKRAAADLAQQLMPADGGDFGCDIIDGSADNADQAVAKVHETIQALLTFPFFGGEKLVWLKSATFLADTPAGRSAAVIEALERLTATLTDGLPESTRFLFSAIDVDKRRAFYKSLSKVARIDVYDRIDASKSGWEEEAAMMVQRLAESRRLQMSSEAAELFTLYTGGDRRVIENELEKLDLYLGPERRGITAGDVRLLVPLSRAGIVFELGNAIAERNLHRALDLLDQLLFQGESAIGILIVAIIPTVRNLLLAKDLMGRHKLARPAQPFFFGKTLDRLPQEAIAHLPRKKDGTVNSYSLGIAAIHAHRYELPELQDALATCLQANVQLVTSSLDPKTLLSQLLVRIVA